VAAQRKRSQRAPLDFPSCPNRVSAYKSIGVYVDTPLPKQAYGRGLCHRSHGDDLSCKAWRGGKQFLIRG